MAKRPPEVIAGLVRNPGTAVYSQVRVLPDCLHSLKILHIGGCSRLFHSNFRPHFPIKPHISSCQTILDARILDLSHTFMLGLE
jgi:hypothetical protein